MTSLISRMLAVSSGVLFLILGLSANSFAQPDMLPSKPSTQITFGKQTLREKDQIDIHVWIVNDGDQQLSSLNLHVSGPAFLKWHADNCVGKLITGSLPLGTLGANDIKSMDLCIESESTIVVGDFNLLFVFDYDWQKAEKHGHSFVSTEKTLKSSFLGSDAVGGVPLALAQYIVPGLFFWLVLSFYWKTPWGVDLPLGDKMVYSIVVSVLIIMFAGLASNIVGSLGLIPSRKLNDFFDPSAGISILKLFVLAGVGLLLGLMVGKIDAMLRKSKEEGLRISDSDDEFLKLEKLLRLNPDFMKKVKTQPDYCPKTTLNFKTSGKHDCSLFARCGPTIWMFGWFAIVLDPNNTEVTSKIQELDKKGELIKMLRTANDNGLSLTVLNLIEREGEATANSTLSISNEDMAPFGLEEDKGKGKLITLQ